MTAGLLPVAFVAALAAAPDPCAGRGTSVVIWTGAHELRLCEDGATARAWRVALGTGGVDKTREGDAKTPLGSYPLGEPRASARFGTFIPIGYPTPAQRRRGYTGGAIGIHGPLREMRDAGARNVAADWTLGCIAVASDDVIGEISAWVRARRVRAVHLL